MGKHDPSHQPSRRERTPNDTELSRLDQYSRALLEDELGLDKKTTVIVVKGSLAIVPQKKSETVQ